MPKDNLTPPNPSSGARSRAGTQPKKTDSREIVCKHSVSTIPASHWIVFDESELNDAADVELGPKSHTNLFEALDHYRAIQSVPPLPPFSELNKRLKRLAKDPSRFEKILQIKPGEYPGTDQRKFRTSRHNVNYHLVQLLLAAGADLAGPPSHEQIAYARESAESLHRAARPGGETTSGRPAILGLSDLMASAIEIQRNAGGTGAVWHWNESSGIYEGFLFDLINFLVSSCLLIDHLEELNAAAPPPKKACASWGTFRAIRSIPDPVLSEETVRQYLRKAGR